MGELLASGLELRSRHARSFLLTRDSIVVLHAVRRHDHATHPQRKPTSTLRIGVLLARVTSWWSNSLNATMIPCSNRCKDRERREGRLRSEEVRAGARQDFRRKSSRKERSILYATIHLISRAYTVGNGKTCYKNSSRPTQPILKVPETWLRRRTQSASTT